MLSLLESAELALESLINRVHEYTLGNLFFYKVVESDSELLLKRIEDTIAMHTRKPATVLSKLPLEKTTNPFLRCHLPSVIQAAENYSLKSLQSSVDTTTVVRYWKGALD